MKSINIPEVRLGIVAVSRDCFPIQLSAKPLPCPPGAARTS